MPLPAKATVMRALSTAGLALALVPLYLLLSIVANLLFRLAGWQGAVAGPYTVAALVLALALPALRRRLAGVGNRSRRPRFDFRRVMGDFTAATRETFDVRSLAEACLAAIDEAIAPSHQAVYLRTESGKHEEVASRRLDPEGRPPGGAPMEDEVVIPLKVGERPIGRLLLGPRTDGSDYGPAELGLLDSLAQSLALSMRNAQLFSELESQARMKRELEIAFEVQMGLLPTELLVPDGAALALTCTPALEVGGDFYDSVRIDADHWGLIVGDVAGKGMPAALMMAVTLTLFRTLAANDTSPAAILARLGQLVHRHRPNKKLFVAAIYAVYDARSGVLTIANAGQPQPLVNGEPVAIKGLPLGATKSPSYKEVQVPLAAGDTFVAYSDGLEDQEDEAGTQFGLDRVQAFFQGRGQETAQETYEALVAMLDAYRGSQPLADDMTVAVLQRTEAAAPVTRLAGTTPLATDAGRKTRAIGEAESGE